MKTRKWIAVLIAGVMGLSLAACGSGGSSGTAGSSAAEASQEDAAEEDSAAQDVVTEEDAAETAQEDSVAEEDAAQASEEAAESGSDGADAGTLVIYFSRTGEQYGVGVIEKGNTEIVAEMIMEETGADRFEIVPAEDYYPYTYNELTDIAKKEQNENARPAYAGEVQDLSQYDTIYIGAPVWWGDWPMICYTFFENHADELAGKTLMPFSTHAGSGLSGFDRKLASACPGATVGTGLAISGADAQNNPDSVKSAVQAWIAGQ